MKQKFYILENLGCANCAAKMEKRIKELPGISDASITFATKQLRISAEDPDRYLAELQNICSSIEHEVIVTERGQKSGCNHQHQHEDSCGHQHHSHSMQSEARAASRDSAPKHEHPHKGGSHRTKDITVIVIGVALYAIGLILEHAALLPQPVCMAAFLAAYLVLGSEILLTAGRNLLHGQIFDENFLMSIATIGALAISQFEEAVGVMLFFRIGELFEHIAVEKSRSQIMDAVDMRPETVTLLHGDHSHVVPAGEVEAGSLILVRPGDRIPLDGTILEGESRLDTSALTGEPVPVKVSVGSQVLSGCVNTSGQLKLRVDKVLEESMVTRILDSVENAAASKPRIDRFITRFARIYTPIVVALALGTAMIPSLITGNWHYWIYTAMSFLVMSCPCALVLSVPLAFFSGIGAGSRLGILFKGGAAIEAMGRIRAVVMDKTGTITEGNFVLQQVMPLGSLAEEELLALCASCEQNSTHPIAASIVAAAREQKLSLETPIDLAEIAGHGIRAKLTDREVLCGNRKLMEQFLVSCEGCPQQTAGSEVLVAVNGRLAGWLVVSDTIKPGAPAAVRALGSQHLVTAMLTGDGAENAHAVANTCGIDEVHARLLPEDKLNRLLDIRSRHGAVMFVGDGINDAPVLAGADVGAAMGSGADAAIEAADVVFMTSSAEAIPKSLAIARSTGRIALENVIFALVIKAAVMILGLCGFASMWAAVFADTGVAMLCILNSVRILYGGRFKRA
ncbi:MAG: cadmium-translocating P-type ATPase [Lachnospiraceae bacterium]|nr:cadmium-translocating P-type ATPase [Lachnospiraceae bacterium]